MSLDPDRPVHAVVHTLYADRDNPACRSRYFHLGIYPTAEALRIAATRYRAQQGRSDDFTEAEGVFQPSPFAQRYDRKVRRWLDTTGAFAGVMRLCANRLTAEVIAHESTHAALHITRLHDWAQPEHDGRADFGDSCDEREEAFAYLLGGITGTVSDLVNDYLRATSKGDTLSSIGPRREG